MKKTLIIIVIIAIIAVLIVKYRQVKEVTTPLLEPAKVSTDTTVDKKPIIDSKNVGGDVNIGTAKTKKTKSVTTGIDVKVGN